MKRLTILLLLVVLVIFGATARAFLQDNLRPRLGTAGNAQSANTPPDALPQNTSTASGCIN